MAEPTAEPTGEPADEDLMRLADRQLDDAARATLLARIADNAQARARVAMYEENDRDLERLRTVGNGPVPARLIDAIWNAPVQQPVRRPEAAGIAAWIRSYLAALTPQMATGLAAVLAVGVAGGWGMTRWSAGAPVAPVATIGNNILAQGTLKRALETGLGGQSFAATSSESIVTATPGLTIRTREGGYCRQYKTAGRDGLLLEGFACRASGGEWAVSLHTPTIATGTSGPAAGAGQFVSDLVREKADGDPLDREDVQAALQRSWQP